MRVSPFVGGKIDVKAALEALKKRPVKMEKGKFTFGSRVAYADKGFQKKYSTIADIVLVTDSGEFNTINNAPDRYHEVERLSTKRYDQELSPLKYWEKKYDEFVKPGDTSKMVSDKLYELCPGQTPFKMTAIRDAILITMPGADFSKMVFMDPCVGNGGALLAAISLGMKKVIGYDINQALSSGYIEMAKDLGLTPDNYQVRLGKGFQTYTDIENVDVIFTSPPFFDVEIYSDDYTGRHLESYDIWVDNFLIPFCVKSVKALNTGGVMLINMADFETMKMCETTNKIMSGLDVKYEGVMGVSGGTVKNLLPIFVWRKI